MSWMFETPSLNTSEKAINCTFQRHARILDNISNIDTPNHVFSDVNFKEYLSGMAKDREKYSLKLSLTDAVHMPEINPLPSDPYPTTTYKDTSLEKEMVALTETTLFFNAMIQLHNLQANSIRTAITGGIK